VTDLGETSGESGAEPTGTTAIETAGESAGQSVAPAQTAGNGTGQDGESFFDYELVRGKPELESAYKDMQRQFTKRNGEFAAGRDKISQYDQFMADPVTTMQGLARQYGYNMVQGQPTEDGSQPKTFENWDDVMTEAKSQVMAELQPLMGEMKSMKMQNVEQSLDNSHPDWRTYEDAMMQTLQAHPTLVGNPDMLYRMSVPESVLEARANRAALTKIQGATESANVQGHSTTTQQASKKPGKMTFEQSVAHARQELARQGLKAPSG